MNRFPNIATVSGIPTLVIVTVALISALGTPSYVYADETLQRTAQRQSYRVIPSVEQLQHMQRDTVYFPTARTQPGSYRDPGMRRRIVLGVLIGAAAGGAFAAATPSETVAPSIRISLGMGLGAVAGGLIARAWN